MFKRKLFAPMTGTAVALSGVPDEAFAGGMLGEGLAIEPDDGHVRAPADGVIESVADTRHAYTFHTDDGLDVLVHVGIDTVSLGGAAFTSLVHAGDRVRTGDIVAHADLSAIRAAGLPTVTPVLIANPDVLRDLGFSYGHTDAGKSPIITYRSK